MDISESLTLCYMSIESPYPTFLLIFLGRDHLLFYSSVD